MFVASRAARASLANRLFGARFFGKEGVNTYEMLAMRKHTKTRVVGSSHCTRSAMLSWLLNTIDKLTVIDQKNKPCRKLRMVS